MKAKVIEPAPEFKPVTLELTFETKEELYAMLAVVNRNSAAIWSKVSERQHDFHDKTSSESWDDVSTKIFKQLEVYTKCS